MGEYTREPPVANRSLEAELKTYACLFALLIAVGCSDDPVSNAADEGITVPNNGADSGDPAIDAASNNPPGEDAGRNNPSGDSGAPDVGEDHDQGGGLTAGWHDRADLPDPQQEVAVVALDGLVYVMGGFNEVGGQLATVVVYDPDTDSWSARADFPTRANHINAVVFEGQIWVTGFLHMGFTPDPRTFIYDPETDAWSPGPDLPTGRGRGSSAAGVIDGLIYVAGGIAPGGVRGWTDVLDPQTGMWTELDDAPRAFDHAGFGVVDGKLIVTAGRGGTIASFFDDVQIFDPSTGDWSNGAPIPTARGGVASAVHDGKIYVFGGEGDPNSPGQVFSQVEVYDVAADSWTELDPMPSPRHGFAGATIGDVIYLPGGAPTQFLDAVATHEIFVP